MADRYGRYKITMDSDCSVLVRDTKTGYDSLVWQSNSIYPIHAPCELTLQEGGRLVALDKNSEIVWKSSLNGGNTSVNWALRVSDVDWNLAVVDLFNEDTVLWSASPDGYGTLPGHVVLPPDFTTASPSSGPIYQSQRNRSPTSLVFGAVVGAWVGVIFVLIVAVCALLWNSRRRSKSLNHLILVHVENLSHTIDC